MFKQKNYNELKDVIDLCIQLNVDILRIQPLMLIGRANSELSEYSLSAKEYTKASDYLVKNAMKILGLPVLPLNGVIHLSICLLIS